MSGHKQKRKPAHCPSCTSKLKMSLKGSGPVSNKYCPACGWSNKPKVA